MVPEFLGFLGMCEMITWSLMDSKPTSCSAALRPMCPPAFL